jgi:hypothetical protein
MSRDTRGLSTPADYVVTSDTSVKQPLVPQISHLAQPSPIAAVHSRREDEDEEAYHEQGHHRPEDHGNRTVSHGATRRIPRNRATAAVTSTRVFMVDMGLPFGGRTSAGTLPAPSRMSARAA